MSREAGLGLNSAMLCELFLLVFLDTNTSLWSKKIPNLYIGRLNKLSKIWPKLILNLD
jgi:hypothetical protein